MRCSSVWETPTYCASLLDRFQKAPTKAWSQAFRACLQEALLALNEAVRIAQQQNDNVALAHALSALCHILATASPAAVTQLIESGAALTDPTAHLSQLLKILRRYSFAVQHHMKNIFLDTDVLRLGSGNYVV